MTQSRTLNNRYELEKKIGDGGMAVVFKAQDNRLNRPVAVKVLRDSYAADPQFLQRFQREARAAAGLNHPNIVNVYDEGQDGEIYYIVMEYIEGTNLKDMITKSGPLPVSEAVRIGSEICDALNYAHEKGLIHRDVKPQNILITIEGKVKVTDFGIAKGAGDQTLTQAGFTLGTVHYFSPEQAKGQSATPRSDIYSIGIVMYEMLTGRIPFESDNPVALAIKHIEEAPVPPRRLNPNIPAALEAIVLRAISKNPDQRFRSATDMGRALRDFETASDMGTVAVQRPTVPPPTNPPRRPQSDDFYEPKPVYQQPIYQDPPRAGSPSANGNRPGYNPTVYEQNNYNQPRGSMAYDNRMPVDPYAPARRSIPEPPPVVEAYEEEAPRGGPGCGTWVAGGLLIAMLAALVVFGFVFLIPSLTKAPPPTSTAQTVPSPTAGAVVRVAVPNVVGKTQAEAETNLRQLKLDVGNTTQEFNEKVEAGRVISQKIAPNTQVNSGTKIDLVVSQGRDTVEFGTKYVNVDPKATEQAIKNLGLQTEIITQPDDKIQAGAVIRTDPEGGPGVKIARSTKVKIFVSAGPLPTATPQPQPSATATAAPATNTAVPPTATSLPATPTPPAPTRTPVAQVAVPSGLISLSEAQATTLLKNQGFDVEVVRWNEDDIRRIFPGNTDALNTWRNLKVGDVLGTDPRENSRVDKGSKITLSVKRA